MPNARPEEPTADQASRRTPRPAPRPAPRPVLRPGVHVVRRDDRHLQVGLERPRVVVLRDDPATRGLLEALRVGAPTAGRPEQAQVLAALEEHDLLVDRALRDEVLRRAPDRAAGAGVLAASGSAAADLMVARSQVAVGVSAPVDVRSDALRLLRCSGLASASDPERADLTLVVTDTVLPRAELDALVRSGRTHLVVAPHGDGMEIGPLVVPGTTACLRCVDAHRAERDPGRSMVLEQCSVETRAAGPVPRDPALLAAAVALAVREVVSWADGGAPLSWSASLVLQPGLPPEHRVWRRHPHCGCAWDELAG